MDELSAANLADFRRRLVERRGEVEALSAGSKEARRPVTLDQASVGRLSRMDAMQGQAMALETERRRQLDLVRIKAALERIDAGEFGWCIACGEPIMRKRLEFDPTAAVCMPCAKGSA